MGPGASRNDIPFYSKNKGKKGDGRLKASMVYLGTRGQIQNLT